MKRVSSHPPLAGPRNFPDIHMEALVSEDALFDISTSFWFLHVRVDDINDMID